MCGVKIKRTRSAHFTAGIMRTSIIAAASATAAVVLGYVIYHKMLRRRRSSRPPCAMVSCSMPYVDAAVRRALTKAGWTLQVHHQPPVDLQWADFSAIAWDDVLSGTAAASMQYLKTGLVRKAELAFYLAKRRVEHWMPLTITADIEDEEDIVELIEKWRAHESKGQLWLLKPSKANRGEGISILRYGDESALRNALSDEATRAGDWLLQAYVQPLLLPAERVPVMSPSTCTRQGYKCHLRVHVVAVGALSVWLHLAPLVLLASSEWSPPSESLVYGSGRGMLAHLTNHAQQQHSASYCEERHTRSFAEAFGESFRADLLTQLRQMVNDVFQTFVKGSAAFFALPHCFEIFGLDVAIDEQGRAFLLEANSGPDLSLHGDRLMDQADNLLSDTIEIVTRCVFRGQPEGGAAMALRPDASAEPAAQAGGIVGGFECVLSRHCEPAAELERFKRSMSTVGKFAHSLHAVAGAPVRGIQARAMAMSGSGRV